MEKILDNCTFGNSQSSINLVGILNEVENQIYAHTASRILTKYLESLKHLSSLPDKNIRETAYKLWRQHFIERVEKSHFPEVIETHAKCVIIGQYRKFMRLSQNRE